MTKYLKYSILFLFGFICCSTLSTYLSFKIGFPIGVPELFAMFFIPFFKNDFLKLYKSYCKYFIQINLLFFLFLGLSLLYNNENATNVFSNIRTYYYLFIFYYYGKELKKYNLLYIYIIGLGAIVGSYINGELNRYVIEDYNAYSNLIAYAIVVAYPLLSKKNILFFLSIFLSFYLAFFSGLRRQILEILISIFLALIIILLRDKHRISKLLVIIMFFIPSLITIFLNSIEDYFYNNNFYLWSRIFYKSQNSIEEEGSRYNHFFNLDHYIANTVIPKGIYPKGISFSVNNSGGNVLDFPLYQLFYAFGSITILILFIIIINKYIKSLIRIFNSNVSLEFQLSSVVVILLMFCCFVDGSFLEYSFVVPFAGFFLGQFLNYKLSKS